MNLWEYALLFGIVIVGGGIALILKKPKPRMLTLVLSFSGAYILGITVLHLMPGIYHHDEGHIGLWVMAGFFIQLMLEQLSRGVEHGHIHANPEAPKSYAYSVMLGLCLHAFMEGMPLSGYEDLHTVAHHGHNHGHDHLLWGIILHKAPAAFALVILLMMSGFQRAFVLACLILFASMSPLGAMLASVMAWSVTIQEILLAVVIGSFLHISTTILFETDSSKSHKVSVKKLLAVLIGLGLATLTIFV